MSDAMSDAAGDATTQVAPEVAPRSAAAWGLSRSALPGLQALHQRCAHGISATICDHQTHHANADGWWFGTWMNDLFFGQRGGLWCGSPAERGVFLAELRKIARHVEPDGTVPYQVEPDGRLAHFNPPGVDLDRAAEFVLMVARAWETTGDDAFALELLPACRRVVDGLARRDLDGDLLPEGRCLPAPITAVGSCGSVSYIGDTCQNDWKDFGVALFYHHALLALSGMCADLGQPGAHALRARADAVAAAARAAFWTGHGFAAWIDRDGTRHDDWITGNNTHAIITGMADERMAAAIADTIEREREALLERTPGRVRLGVFVPGQCSNPPEDYWNGGAWPLVTGPIQIALARTGRWATLERFLERLAQRTPVTEHGFHEAYDGATGAPGHADGLLMNNGGFIWGLMEGALGLGLSGRTMTLRNRVANTLLPATARCAWRGAIVALEWVAGDGSITLDGVELPISDGVATITAPARAKAPMRIRVAALG
ncbi:MAG TPA: hypothetical protein VEL07_09600 [Planctomycetota bacterium]|nr:hypothetical protein [Planctomycetota bacterium]